MGLGPHGASLQARVGRRTETMGELELLVDQRDRGEARMRARIRHAAKHRTPAKPLAPVEETDSKIAVDFGRRQARLWIWRGEAIPSKGLVAGEPYRGDEIRNAGFKLPKLKGRPKNATRKTKIKAS